MCAGMSSSPSRVWVQYVGALGHGAREPRLEVAPHVGTGVLVEGQRGGGVLDQHVEQAHLELADLRDRRDHLPGDEMEPLGKVSSWISFCFHIGGIR